MKKPEEETESHFRKRSTETVSMEMPEDTLKSLQKVAARRDMSSEALPKFYIGQGLGQDLSRLYADQVLETTAQVLARHIQSEEEVSTIIRGIRVEVVR